MTPSGAETEIIMKNTKLIALAAAVAVSVSVFPILVHGDILTSTPPTTNVDPLVSLSYINEVVLPKYDQKIEELTTKVNTLTGTVTILQNELGALAGSEGTPSDTPVETPTPGAGQYEVVYLTQGSKLMAKSPCEIILRTGRAIAVSIISNGINDITDGSEILNASAIPLYHCLLVPRGNDGRGIQIMSPDAYVMVRGEYEIVQ